MACAHEKFETLKVHEEYISFAAWTRVIATVRCLGCEKELRMDICIGRIERLKFKHEHGEQAKCLHFPFTVDPRSIAIQIEMERDSNVSRVVLTDDIKYRRFWLAVATCNFCAFKFYVKSFFEEKREGVTLTMQRKTPWRHLKRRFGEDLAMKCVPFADVE